MATPIGKVLYTFFGKKVTYFNDKLKGGSRSVKVLDSHSQASLVKAFEDAGYEVKVKHLTKLPFGYYGLRHYSPQRYHLKPVVTSKESSGS